MCKVCWKHACFKTWSSSWTTTPKLSQHDEVDPLQCPLTGCLCTSPKVEVNTQFLPSKPEAEGWVGPLTCTERSSPQGALTVCWLSRLVGENSKTSMEQRTWGWKDFEENLTQHHHLRDHWGPGWGKWSTESHVTSAGTNPEHKHSSSNSGFKEFPATSQKQSGADVRDFSKHSRVTALTTKTRS